MKLKTLKSPLKTLGSNLRTLDAATTNASRLRGRAAVERRARWLRKRPICAICEAAGKVTAAGVVVDHVRPLWAGGCDLERNLQTLCIPHHDLKSACEAAMRAAGGWLASHCSCGMHQNPGG